MAEPVILTYPVPLKGLNTDGEPTEFTDAYSPMMINAFVELTKIRKRRGYSKLGNLNLPLTGIGMELIDYLDARGLRHLIALTTTKAYKYNTTEDGWDNISNFYKELHACESSWTAGTSVTAAYDTTYYKEGSKSLKLTCTAARADGDKLAYSADFGATKDCSSATYVGFWVRSSVALAANALEIVVAEDTTAAKTNHYTETLTTAAIPANTWVRVDVATDLALINLALCVGVYANATIANGTVIYIDAIEVYKPFTGGATNRWSWCLASDATETTPFSNNGHTALIISNGVDDLFYYEGHSGDIFKTLVHGSSAANVVEITEFWNHLFFINYNDGSQNVRSLMYGSAGDVDDFATGTSGAHMLTDTSGKLMRAVKLGSSIILYSENSITMGRYYGGATIFTFPTMVYNTGLLAPGCVWGFVNVHFILGTDQRVYAYFGETQLEPVGDNIEKMLFSAININNKDHIVTGLDIGKHKVHFFIPEAADTYASHSYCFNYRRSELSWEYHNFADSVKGMATFVNAFAWYCDEAPWATRYCDFISLYCDDSYGQVGYGMSTFISADGYVYKLDEAYGSDDDEPILFSVQTPDFIVNREEDFGRWQWFSLQMYSAVADSTVIIAYSIDSGSSWNGISGDYVSLSRSWATYRIPIDVVSRRIRFIVWQHSDKDVQLRGLFKCKVVPQPSRD